MSARLDPSPGGPSRRGRQLRLLEAPCEWCAGPLVASRVDARHCSKSCRQAAHRARIRRADLDVTAAPMRLAYADPPYPGHAARYYRHHRDFAGEVDHAALLSRLQHYDGWALSTSAVALPAVLSTAVAAGATVRVAAWLHGGHPHATARLRNAWEPVVFAGGRQLPGSASQSTDVLAGVAPRRRTTHPDALIGMKPPAFCAWLFGLLGAGRGDTLDDLYPGSGIVGWCWRQYVSPIAAADAKTSYDVASDRSRGSACDASCVAIHDGSSGSDRDMSRAPGRDVSHQVLRDG